MRFCVINLIFSILIPIYSHGQNMPKNTAQTNAKQVTYKTSLEIIPPPVPGFKTRFLSITEWLTAVATGNQPQKAITKYNIDLFEAPGAYTLSLTGVNTYNEGINVKSSRIDYTPREMYCDLPASYYQSQTREHLLAKIVADIKNFTATPVFKNSFLAGANLIVLGTNGEVIWAKKVITKNW